MKLNIYSIYDKASRTYNTPFFQPTDAQALRMFKVEINRADPTNLVYLNPEDFELYHLGHVDLDTGLLETTDRPGKLASADALKA